MAHIKRKKLFCYGFLAWPLAFIEICLFIFIPQIYHQQYGVSLFVIGSIFLITKIFNLSCVPVLGLWSDKLNLRKVYRKKVIYMSLPFLALLYHFLLFPPNNSYWSVIFFYVTTCLVFSLVAINYYAMSVEITKDYRAQNQLSGSRTAFSLLGYLTATLYPTIIMKEYSFKAAYNEYIFFFIALLFTAGVLLHFVKCKSSFIFHSEISAKKLWDIACSKKYSKLLTVILLNGISQGLIATFILFYIKYVIHAEDHAGQLMIGYYLSAIISIPVWVRFSANAGKKNSWILAMTLSSCFFFSTFFLGSGDIFEFAIICIAAGACFGGELILSPSIFSDSIERQEKASSCYSLWLLMNKVSMTICVLTLLSILGFYGMEMQEIAAPKLKDQGNQMLELMFCIVPALFKLVSLSVLFTAKVDKKFSHEDDHHEDHHHDHGIALAK